jgi:arabinofuranosyltransferase
MHVTWQSWKVHRSRAVLTIVIVATPALAWTLFSTWYYGFPFPNTAAAKMTIAELGLGRRVDRGAVYYMLSLRWDALGFVAILVALFFAAFTGARRSLLGLLGVVIYLAYVLVTASAATHMAGRFFAIPFVLAFYVTAHLLVTRETGAAILFMGMAYSCVNPVASWKLNTSWYQTLTRSQGGYIDTLWFAHREASGLLKPEGGIVNVCLEDGKRFGATPERLQLGGCGGGDPIGFFAFAAGPDKWIVDPLGLPDPLLARLQPCVDFRTDQWRPGHFRREVPDGYLESIRSADNHIKDAGVREYYGILRNIVSGPLWSPARLKSIVLLNLGVYNRLLDPYNRAVVARARSGQCRF